MTTTTYRISSTISGLTLGDYEGETPAEALDAMARDAGYKDQAEALATTGEDGADLIVREVQS